MSITLQSAFDHRDCSLSPLGKQEYDLSLRYSKIGITFLILGIIAAAFIAGALFGNGPINMNFVLYCKVFSAPCLLIVSGCGMYGRGLYKRHSDLDHEQRAKFTIRVLREIPNGSLMRLALQPIKECDPIIVPQRVFLKKGSYEYDSPLSSFWLED